MNQQDHILVDGVRPLAISKRTLTTAFGGATKLVDRLTADFVRRIEFRVFKYSMIYHWLLGKTSNEIDREDVNWGVRLAMLHISDLRYIIDSVQYAELQDLMRRAEDLRLKFGANLSPRHLLMYLKRYIKSMPEAESLYSLLVEKENAAKGMVEVFAEISGNSSAGELMLKNET